MDIFYLMKQFNFRGGWLSYPPKFDYLKKYDYCQTSDGLKPMEISGEKNITRLFHDLFRVNPVLSTCHLTLDSGAQQAMKLSPRPSKSIAIQVDSGNGVNKSYPVEYIYRLSVMLSESGYEVYFVGSEVRLNVKDKGNIHDFVDRTPTIVEYVALLSQMDGIITPDSAGVHIGGLLNIPTLVLFSVTYCENVDHYPSVTSLASKKPCAPCMNLYKCPAGHDSCVAFQDSSIAPEQVFNTAVEMIEVTHEKGATEK